MSEPRSIDPSRWNMPGVLDRVRQYLSAGWTAEEIAVEMGITLETIMMVGREEYSYAGETSSEA